jgi:hypothetical protein
VLAKSKVIIVALVCAFALTAHTAEDKKAKEQKEIRKVAQKILQQLYKAEPPAKEAVEHPAGYAVFNNMGVKIVFTGSGKGIAVDNKTKKETFMKMMELQAGLGIGVKKFNVVFCL